ncbi:hypothetical protein EDC02_0767 [Micromonospora sp. Llam0]|uniref:hypothetical protein n=1 Tax=Micromonosporaceae TaxID=28056 RepID=UPI000F9BBDFB|nr:MULTISPECIES: hypothetical protein [Micromonosporaceae]ROO58992.1 hypothetical protein EDC02_0767 [Micromonospora sp. Llam0]WFE19477.1 hypothetical protein O7621_16140 [Solwaraspora sp. WMMD937]
MSTQAPTRNTTAVNRPMAGQPMADGQAHQMDMNAGMRPAITPGTETKSAFRSTEFYVYLIAVAGVLLASQVINPDIDGVQGTAGGGDPFPASTAWLYVALLTIGYVVSRGLAKAGSAWRNSGERQR